jgi:hypothetical protein
MTPRINNYFRDVVVALSARIVNSLFYSITRGIFSNFKRQMKKTFVSGL